MTTFLRALLTSAVLLLASTVSAGQRSDALYDPTGTQSSPPPGWSLTPGLLVSRGYDDNVLVRGPGDPRLRDYITTINPRGAAEYVGPRGSLSAQYDGAFTGYQSVSTLNSYSQHGDFAMKRDLSKRSTFRLNATATAAPTTELLQFTGVPFVRVGVFADTVRAGFERLMSKNLTMTVGGNFEQARFDPNQAFASSLLGGHNIGADVSLRDRLTERMSLTADADVQHATIGVAQEQFDIQHVTVGVDYQLSEGFRVFAAGGVSRLGLTTFGPPRTGPSVRLGLSEHYRGALIDVTFNRSFVPSFGIGGTTQNEDLTARIRLPIMRRIYTQDLVSWQREDPLVVVAPQLRSVWLQAAVGYVARPWVRIEAYFSGTRQTAGRIDDQLLQHNQFGIQVIASKPVRIR